MKGNLALDGIVIFIFIGVMFLAGLLGILTFGAFNDKFQEVPTIDAETKDTVNEYNISFKNVLDAGFMLYLAILWVGALVSSYFLDSSPIYFVIFFILGVLCFFIIIPIANLFITVAESTVFEEALTNFQMTYYVVMNMGKFFLAYLVTVGGAMYMKTRGYY